MRIKTDYSLILAQLKAVTESERDTIANLSNASAVLNMNLAEINWAGFYLVRGNQLILGPFQGRPACVRIAFGKGVCGTAADAGVNFIKNQRRNIVVIRQHRLNRQHNSGQLAAGRYHMKRLRFFSHIGGNQKLGLVGAVFRVIL